MIQCVEVYLLDEVHVQDFQDVVSTNRKVELFDRYPTIHHWQPTALDCGRSRHRPTQAVPVYLGPKQSLQGEADGQAARLNRRGGGEGEI